MTKIDPELAQKCKAWPFQEAKAVEKRLRAMNRGQVVTPEKGYVLFETGYGPSGLPHIGTFGEVCRTSMVMQAFRTLYPEIPTKMICFSDDMDGFRKVPTNVPNQEMLEGALGMPLSSVPNPFVETHNQFQSFGAHNNAKLREFLDQFGFEYEFLSSTEDCYKNGRFNETLGKMLAEYEAIRGIVLPLLGEERAATYSPLFPIVQKKEADTDHPIILHNAILREVIDAGQGVARFEVMDNSELERSGYAAGEMLEQSIFDGGCKAQWRVDWALRWYALDVDYEMAGKDLVTAADIAAKIVQHLGGRGPAGFRYEMFLDEKGEKISKSKGNGLTMEEWLAYAPHESLAYYMYQRPTSAKKLYFDIIPKAVDEYITFVDKYEGQEDKQRLESPLFYIHNDAVPEGQRSPVSFALLLNLVNAGNTNDSNKIWGFIQQYAPNANPENEPFLNRLVDLAIRYYEDFVLPTKSYRLADEREQNAMRGLVDNLRALPDHPDTDDLQTAVFSAGKDNGYDKSELREWFQALYQILLGQNEGPRFGSFIAVFGKDETIQMIEDALDGKFANAA